jgi:hypothetical protein
MTSEVPPEPAGTGQPSAEPRGPAAARVGGAGRAGGRGWRRHSARAEAWQALARLAEGVADPGHAVPAWMRPTRGERRWPINLSIIAAIVLQVLLPPRFTELPPYLIPALEGALLIGLNIGDPVRVERGGTLMRTASIALVVLVTAANAISAVLLIRAILDVKTGTAALPLFATGASIWGTNVIAFGLWYWEFDRGGPVRRVQGVMRHPDLMFPQMASPQLAPPDWEPHFIDYLYLAFTNATAFSPTDVMPLARWAKVTMAVQSAVSLSVGALVIARAVNVLRT